MGKHYGNAGGVESTTPIHENNALLSESREIALVGIFVLPLVPFNRFPSLARLDLRKSDRQFAAEKVRGWRNSPVAIRPERANVACPVTVAPVLPARKDARC